MYLSLPMVQKTNDKGTERTRTYTLYSMGCGVFNKWLCRVAKTFEFQVKDCGRAWGCTERLLSRYEPACMLTARSVIIISESLLWWPIGMALTSPEEKKCRQFELAVTIIHEIAHATLYALTNKEHEDFFEDSTIADAGFELETRLFGLSPQSEPPGSARLKWYTFVDGKRTSASDVVDTAYIHKLFSRRFWKTTLESGDATAILAPSLHALRDVSEAGWNLISTLHARNNKQNIPESVWSLICKVRANKLVGRKRKQEPLPVERDQKRHRQQIKIEDLLG